MIKPEGGLVAIKLRKSDIKSNNNSSFQQLNDDDQGEDTLNFYDVSILASINVGVCLFEAVAPVRNNDMRLLLLQLLYGEKINDLMVETGHTHVSGTRQTDWVCSPILLLYKKTKTANNLVNQTHSNVYERKS
ncbi:hypothetical protein Bca4012_020311 [Brassica carinata]